MDTKEKIDKKNLDINGTNVIGMRLTNFFYQVINEEDKKLKKEDLEVKYKFLSLVYDFFEKDVGIKL